MFYTIFNSPSSTIHLFYLHKREINYPEISVHISVFICLNEITSSHFSLLIKIIILKGTKETNNTKHKWIISRERES